MRAQWMISIKIHKSLNPWNKVPCMVRRAGRRTLQTVAAAGGGIIRIVNIETIHGDKDESTAKANQ
jgi:hypothetical protein